MLLRLLAACLVLGAGASAAPVTVALVHDATIPEHAALAEAFSRTSADRVIAVGPEQPWTFPTPPAAVVAVGDAADERAEQRWPDRPRASLWRIAPPPTPTPETAGDARAGPPRLWISAHTEAECTAAALRRAAPGPGPWLIVAGPGDAGAERLAASLGAELLRGELDFVARGLRARRSTAPRIWIRAAPQLAVEAWLVFLGRAARRPGATIGLDAPAAPAWGLQRWVRPDPIGTAAAADAWVRAVTGRGGGQALPRSSHREAPCRAISE